MINQILSDLWMERFDFTAFIGPVVWFIALVDNPLALQQACC
jgi:hypothetical protein